MQVAENQVPAILDSFSIEAVFSTKTVLRQAQQFEGGLSNHNYIVCCLTC